jgi:lipoteichoic acid synthase
MGKLFHLAWILLWVKTYMIQRFAFELPVEGWVQEFIVFMNPVSSIALMFAIALAMSKRYPHISVILVSFFASLLMYINLIYYRCFSDFITYPVLLQSSNLEDLWTSIFTLVRAGDLLLFADTALLIALVIGKKYRREVVSRRQWLTLFQSSILLFGMNWAMAEYVRPELLSRTFDRHIVVKSIGAFNYFLYDIVTNVRLDSKKAIMSKHDLTSVKAYRKQWTQDQIDPGMFGIAKGRNVFLISMESLQSFVIKETANGQVITPFLNRLIQDSFYFNNFYHQTGQGKTSDAEFMIDTSLYALPNGAVFFTHPQNLYQSLPKSLHPQGYFTAVFHANHKTFWNRSLMYPALGYDRFYSSADYQIHAGNSVGWGLKDIPFFDQSVDKIRSLPQPFYAKLITLTNHYPFTLQAEDRLNAQYTSESATLNRYLLSVRYADEALKHFFEQIKSAGLYRNSIFILYGDHNGISQKHNKAMAAFLGKEKITPVDTIQLQRVPLIIHIPGKSGRLVSTVSGQVDLKPTLLHLLGIDIKNDLLFGNDLFAPNKPQLAVLRNGSFITDKLIYTRNKCYDKAAGTKTESSACQSLKEKVANLLHDSDTVIYGDLLKTIEQ